MCRRACMRVVPGKQDLVRLLPIGGDAALISFRIEDVVEAMRMTL